MAERTEISWAEATFNPWIGCTRVSPACDSCYAEKWGARFGVVWGDAARRRTSASTWRQPIHWDRSARLTGQRPQVFCASLSDIGDNQVPIDWFVDLLELIRRTPNLDWLLLTKRPQNIVKRLQEALAFVRLQSRDDDLADWIAAWLAGSPPANVALGTSAENQEEADRRIPVLFEIPAAAYFVSCEPLLGRVDIQRYLRRMVVRPNEELTERMVDAGWSHSGGQGDHPGLGLVIGGGETDANRARATHIAWARFLRDQSVEAGTAFHWKHWGEWAPRAKRPRRGWAWDSETDSLRLGKKHTGRLLDGSEWNGRLAL